MVDGEYRKYWALSVKNVQVRERDEFGGGPLLDRSDSSE